MWRFAFSVAAAFCLVPLTAERASALEIRAYSSARHDRFTGFPTAPVVNTATTLFNGSQYTGVGWSVSETNRQFVLVSPKHFLLPSHWLIGVGNKLRFLGSDGQLHTYTVASTTQISENGTGTDLTLGRLVETVPLSAGVAPLPYLNLQASRPNQNPYVGQSLLVFGAAAKVGTGSIMDFGNMDIGKGTVSLMYRFPYSTSGSGQDDCYFALGDSGSPSFVLNNGKPALVGTHSAVSTASSPYYNYDTFVPHYVSQLDALMAADSWRMIPSNAAANTLTRSAATSPATLRQANAGSATFTVQNATNDANNLRVSLTFPTGCEPTSVSADGWIADETGPLTWSFHRLSLAASSSAALTASWSAVPSTSSFQVGMTTRSDGSESATSAFTFTPSPSFAAWSSGLAQPGLTDDPDLDGLTNLEEYAFGGDPANGGGLNASGIASRPVLSAGSGSVVLRFPVRSDSAARGLWYVVEYSQTLADDWTEIAPVGTSTSYAPYSPAVDGFVEGAVTIPVEGVNQFARVKVVFDENATGMTVP